MASLAPTHPPSATGPASSTGSSGSCGLSRRPPSSATVCSGSGRAWNGRQASSASSSAMSRSPSLAKLIAVSRYCGSSAVVPVVWVAGTAIPAAATRKASTPTTAMARRSRAGEGGRGLWTSVRPPSPDGGLWIASGPPSPDRLPSRLGARHQRVGCRRARGAAGCGAAGVRGESSAEPGVGCRRLSTARSGGGIAAADDQEPGQDAREEEEGEGGQAGVGQEGVLGGVPDAGGQGLEPGWGQQEGGGQLLHGRQQHEPGPGEQAGGGQGELDGAEAAQAAGAQAAG